MPTDRPVPPRSRRHTPMFVIGIDAHKRSHTAVIIDGNGRKVATKTCETNSKDHLTLLRWAAGHGDERVWAIEDCRNMTRRLERDLLAAGERIVRVPPKLMANMRDSARTFGKSDPIDALAIARAALRETDLPVARLDGPERDVRLLVDHREDLVAQRTRMISRLRWHLHELDPSWEPIARSLDRPRGLNQTGARLEEATGVVARLARELVERCRELNSAIKQLEAEITQLVEQLAPSLLVLSGCGPLTAAKILGEPAAASSASAPTTPTLATTAPHPCPSGHRTARATGSAAAATV